MNRTPHHEQDYAFGQVMLTLRTSIGLTQASLAEHLGVSRRAIGEWEAGNSYPKAKHLKEFIALAIKQRAFAAGREEEEIRVLWRAARQKMLLDVAWLGSLLAQQNLDGERGSKGAGAHTLAGMGEVDWPELAKGRTQEGVASGPRLDWSNAPAAASFYGREWELAMLAQWVVEERCRVVSILGLGGIGKSVLAVNLMHRVAPHFEVVIWRSVRNAPTCEALLDDCLQLLAPEALGEASGTLDQRIDLLLQHLRSTRTLLVLDNLESLLDEGERTGRMHADYEGYGRLLRRIAETEHQSCLLLTSREKPEDLVPLEGSHPPVPVRVLRLSRLGVAACEQLLAEKGVVGTAPQRAELIEAYAGNPLALKIVAQTIYDLFNGDAASFLEQGETIYGGIRDLLAEQFNRLSNVQRSIMFWLAILREPVTFRDVEPLLVTPVPRAQMLEAVEALRRRSLIEPGKQPGSFTLQSVVLEYVTGRLTSEAGEEIQTGRFSHLIGHGLELAQAREYVRQSQERLIIAPILTRLRTVYHHQAAVEERLLTLLGQLTTWTGPELAEDPQGYGPANLVALLRQLRGNLRGVDLSGLALRSAYLQGVEMQDASLSEATIRDCIFSETFGSITAVAISSTGAHWATSGRRGEIRVWEAGQAASAAWALTLRLVWRAHADIVWTLAFSPDESTLASASWDGTFKLWDVASGALLWASGHTSAFGGVAFSPDGSLLASSGGASTILWDPKRGRQVQTLPQPDLVTSVAVGRVSRDCRVIAAGDEHGDILLWEEIGTGPATYRQTLAGHTKPVVELAFAPDGKLLASASYDSTVKLWDVGNVGEVVDGGLRQTLSGHRERVNCVAWGPDGRTLASGSRDQVILLWDTDQNSYRAALLGHTAGVYGLAFTPDSRTLLSGSEDGTVRLWDTTNGKCIRVTHGYTATLNDLDWSPDGARVVSAGTDKLATIFAVVSRTSWAGESPPSPRVLRGHTGALTGIAWSPDARWVASSEWDNVIRLWDPVSGESRQVVQHPVDPRNYFYGLAWSPDGQCLAAGTYSHGVAVFEVAAGSASFSGHRSVEVPGSIWIRSVAWKPDGAQYAGGGNDGVLYVWDAESGTLLRRLTGHRGAIKRVAWSPGGTRLASGGTGIEGGELFVWDPQLGERTHTLAAGTRTGMSTRTGTGMVYAVAWGSSEDLLISSGGDGTLRWWDIQSGECILVRVAHQGTVLSLKRSPDGTRVASCGDDGAVMLWDLRSGEHLQTLRRDRPYERLNITGIKGLTGAQMATLQVLGAFEEGEGKAGL